jgi:VanZ family protein
MKRKIYIISALCYATLIFILSSSPKVPSAEGLSVDKVGHVVEYSILGFLVLGCFEERNNTKIVVLVISLCSLYGVLNEIYQQFIPTRYSSSLDMFANSVGSVLGTMINLWFYRRNNRWIISQSKN